MMKFKILILLSLVSLTSLVEAGTLYNCKTRQETLPVQIFLDDGGTLVSVVGSGKYSGQYSWKIASGNSQLAGFAVLNTNSDRVESHVAGDELAANLAFRPPTFTEGFGWLSTGNFDDGVECTALTQEEPISSSGMLSMSHTLEVQEPTIANWLSSDHTAKSCAASRANDCLDSTKRLCCECDESGNLM